MGLSYTIGHVGFRAVFRLYFRGRVSGVEHIPREGGFLLASNHASFLDPPMVGQAVSRPICFVARKSLFRWGPVNALLRSWNAIPVDRDEVDIGGMREILNALKRGQGVMIFPEGTRTRDGALQAGRPGVGFLVARAGVPVVPARIWGSFEAMGRGKSWPRPVRLCVAFGPPLRFDVSTIPREDRQDFYRKISEEIMAAIARLTPPS